MTNSSETIQIVDKTPLVEQLNQGGSPLGRYQDKVIGNRQLWPFLKYELIHLLGANLSGSLGYWLRKLTYKHLFKCAGVGVIFGKGIGLRHPGQISLGDRVAVDDYVLLDASGADEKGIEIADDVIISRNCVIQGKTGPVTISNKTDIGCNTILTSGGGIFIGSSVLIAANCYIGGGRYLTNRTDIPMMEQGVYTKGPVVIENDVWLGAGAVVLDGVHIGKGCIVGAGAVVTKNLPDYSVAVGVPAQIIRQRSPITKGE